MHDFLKHHQIFNEAEATLYKIGQIASRLGVSKATIHNWLKRGLITGHKFGKNRYFTEQEILEAFKSYGWKNRLYANED